MREVFLADRSSWWPVCFNLRSVGVKQGEEVLKETVLRGARVLRDEVRVELRWFVSSSGEMRVKGEGGGEPVREMVGIDGFKVMEGVFSEEAGMGVG